MARLAPAKPHGIDPIRRLTRRYTERVYGRTMEPAEIWAHHRPLLMGISAAGLAVDKSRALPARLKELAMLRSAQLTECEWCLDFGSRLAQDAGVPADDLRELSNWQKSARFDDLDRLVLEYAEGMTRTPAQVSDELFARLREHFDERQIVALTMTIAMENLYNRSNHALGVESQGFSEGMYCAMPDGSANLSNDATRQVESIGRRS